MVTAGRLEESIGGVDVGRRCESLGNGLRGDYVFVLVVVYVDQRREAKQTLRSNCSYGRLFWKLRPNDNGFLFIS